MDIQFESGFSMEEALHMIYEDDEDVSAIYLCPPDPRADTDEDSADEDDGGLVDNLSGRQLSAPVELRPRRQAQEDNHVDVSESEDERECVILEKTYNSHKLEKVAQKRERKAADKNRKWINGDLEKETHFETPDYSAFRCKSPVELFSLFFDDEIFNYILDETTKYALYKNCLDPNISVDELKCFFGILILSGYHNLPGRRFFWDQQDDMGVNIVRNGMRRNRFEQIMRFLHFSDNTHVNTKDKMWKLRPLMQKLKHKFLKYYLPTEHMNYDESMIKYYGKHGCKQFIRGKPIRFGYKCWCLNAENGYLINFELYHGKNRLDEKATEYEAEFGSVSAPLVSMLDEMPVKNLPYQIFTDNLFTSYTLLNKLKCRKYGVTGTLRDNRVPKSCPISNKKAMGKKERGTFETSISKEEGIIITRWKDNAVVTAASTSYGNTPISTVKRYSQAHKKINQVQRPFLIGEYNTYMGGTDRMDEDVARYRIGIRGKKWYWPIFTWLIDVALQNSWILNRQSIADRQNTPNLVFRREIAQVLIKSFGTPPTRPGRPAISSNSIFE